MSLRILVVEDEQIVAADLEAKLQRIGHEVVGLASSGEQAVRLATEHRPTLVLMDVRLQGAMDGCEAARQIQALFDVPVIFLTAYADVFLRNPTQMGLPGVCLTKPFSMYQLQATLAAVLPGGAQTDPGER